LLEPILLPVTVTLTASSAVISPGQSATLTATVTPVNPPVSTAEQHPTGTVLFYAGTTPLGSASVAAGVGDNAVATIVVPHLPAGAYVITAQYAGDATYGPALSNSLNLGIEDFTVTCTAPDGSTNLKIKQGTTGTATCLVASLGGLTGPIQIVCAEQNPPQVGAIGCTFFPTILDGGGKTKLTVVTTAGNISELRPGSGPGSDLRAGRPPGSLHGPPAWPAAGGGVALAFAGLLLSPIGRRARWFRQSSARFLALALLLAGMAGAGLGCSNSVVSTNNGGTPLGVHTLKITAAADVNTVTVSHYAYLTVNVTP
jgi:Bacterial Ig-like domain (group 3)